MATKKSLQRRRRAEAETLNSKGLRYNWFSFERKLDEISF